MSGLNIVMIIALGILSIVDIKNKTIPVWFVVLFAIVCFTLRLLEGISMLEVVLGLLPGIVLLILAIWSKEKIGIGDALVVCILGIGYEVEKVIVILGSSLFLIAICAIGLLVIKKANRKTELPFLPYLFIGNLLMCWIK